MNVIEITEGTYKIRGRDTSMSGIRFAMVEGFKMGSTGGFVTCLLYTSPSPRDS